jgi:two-component system OmpR family response regulator
MAGPKILIVDDNTELLTLLASMLEDAGYTPLPCSRGKAAIEKARSEKPALAVIDVLLPDVMGYEVAAVCRRELSLPVIFLTGVFKGGRHALEAKSKYDALGYFEKPFESVKLMEAISKVVAPARRQPPPPPPEEAVGIDIDLDDQGFASNDPLELTGRIDLREQSGFSASLQGDKLRAVAPVPSVGKTPAGPLAPPVALAPRTGAVDRASGDLLDNLPALITAFYQSQKTGEISLTRGKTKKVVYFEQGQPVFAISNVLADRFGQFLVRVGKIDQSQLAAAIVKVKQDKRRTGDVLMEMGLLREAEKLYYVGQQVKAIIYSLFGWEAGRFELTFQENATHQAIKLDLPPATLIVRGVKKIYRPERLRKLVRAEDRLTATRDPPFQLTEVPLEPWEAQLLPRIDGTHTVAEVVALSQRPEPAVLATLAAWLSLRLLEKKPA